MDVLVAVLALLALGVVALVTLALRRRLLSANGGLFNCSLRERPARRGKGWMLGIARYAEDTLEWYRVFSWAPRPRWRLARRGLEIVARREPSTAEAHALLPGAVVVECTLDGRPLELAMGADALTGFLAWVEAAPPGRGVNVA